MTLQLAKRTLYGVLLATCVLLSSTATAQIYTPELTSEDRTDTHIDGPLTLVGKLSAQRNMDVFSDATSWGVSAPNSKNNHLRLRSDNTGNGLDYIGLQFEMQGQFWNMLRVNFNGFHFTDGDSFSYRNVYVKNIQESSDRSLKTNIRTIADPLALVDSLRGVRFDWIESGEPSVGFIAQEVKAVLPEVVHGMDGGLSVGYSNIIAVAIEAIKALKAENTTLRTKNEAVNVRAEALESRVTALEAMVAELAQDN